MVNIVFLPLVILRLENKIHVVDYPSYDICIAVYSYHIIMGDLGGELHDKLERPLVGKTGAEGCGKRSMCNSDYFL